MNDDRFVNALIGNLPQLRDQPEWRERGATVQTRGLADFSYWILAPYVRRLVDGGDRNELPRVLQVIEELASHTEALPDITFLCEWSIFRRKYRGADLPLEMMGPRLRAIVEDIQARWAPWEPVIGLLFPFFDEVIEHVRSAYPDLVGERTAEIRSGGNAFHAYASFMYDRASQRYEDLLLEFTVTDDSVRYEVERGTGHARVVNPPPATLPAEGAPDYLPALLQYAASAVDFTWKHLPTILAQLREPYDLDE